jgi:hypothetical protein
MGNLHLKTESWQSNIGQSIGIRVEVLHLGIFEHCMCSYRRRVRPISIIFCKLSSYSKTFRLPACQVSDVTIFALENCEI